jgi:hypothetical protein
MMIRGSANQLTNEQQSAQQPSDTQHLAQAVVNQQPAMTTVRCNCSQSCVLWGMHECLEHEYKKSCILCSLPTKQPGHPKQPWWYTKLSTGMCYQMHADIIMTVTVLLLYELSLK